MKRDSKLNPFDPQSPEYWFRNHLIAVAKVYYKAENTPGNWGYNDYIAGPVSSSLVVPDLIKSWNERTYESSYDPNPSEEELSYLCNALSTEYGEDPELIQSVITDLDVNPGILDKIKETKKMMENSIKH